MNQPATWGASSWLRMAVFFSKAFGTFTDFLKDQFKLVQLFWRDVLKRTFDECSVPAKEREEHFSPFFRQRHRSDPPILAAFYAAYKALLV